MSTHTDPALPPALPDRVAVYTSQTCALSAEVPVPGNFATPPMWLAPTGDLLTLAAVIRRVVGPRQEGGR